jgi:isoleucyl-tRNA synthetase
MSDQTQAADDATKARQKLYKKSLNLPKTDFSMRANLAQNEPQTSKRWKKAGLYEQMVAARADAKPFVFHDGPPYANGDIHVGHLLNKVLKDIVVRSRTLMGQRCEYVPGWDCHGLPIEHKVMGELVESGKIEKINSLDEDTRRMAIRRECAKYAQKYQKLQTGQMQRLLTVADYDHPYLTMTPDYEAAVLDVFASLVDQGIVFRDLKPVHWSIANETALADAELEYHDREDPSVYVHFDALDAAKLSACFSAKVDAASFMIWTTTPWTLPSNMLIAVHRDYEYQLLRVDGRCTVLATELAKAVLETGAADQVEVLGSVRGKALVGLEYQHPFCDRVGRIVEADYVTLEDGTGLVHTAPGHGVEDFQTGAREGVPVYCPVQADGRYDDSVPEWLVGQTVWEGNDLVIEKLRTTGHMFHDHRFSHSYPHDWRSKTPTIFRCTEQWFIGVDQPTRDHEKSLRELALAEAESKIRFVPGWGQNRLRGMLESRPDWCISRQRSWGLPIPAFRATDGACLLTSRSVRAIAQVFGREGSDAWFTMGPAELLADYDLAADPEAPSGIEISQLEKMYDIFDVWFESGSSWNAVMKSKDRGYPMDLYLEGSDQHRGWFQLSLLPALGVTGMSPFKNLLTHGFMVDKNGRKMSKSLGNALQVEDLLAQHGADVCRWWVSSLAFEADIKVDPEFFNLAGESYRKVRNTLRFLLSNLGDFDTATAPPLEELDEHSLDRYALHLTADLQAKVLDAYRNYEFRTAHLLLFDFCNETLSAVYLNAVKDRLYCDRADSPRRRATQAAMAKIAEILIELLAPILAHSAEEAWRALGHDDSVHLRHIMPFEMEAPTSWSAVLAAREEALKALEAAKADGIENSLDAGLRVGDADGALVDYASDLADLFGVSRVELDANAPGVEVQDLRSAPRCERSWRRDSTVKQREDGGWLSDRDAAAVNAG